MPIRAGGVSLGTKRWLDYARPVQAFTEADLPDDPRGDYVDTHGPDGRIARVREVEGPFTLDADGRHYEMPDGGFLVWEDGVWRAVTREELLDGAWDLDVGISLFEALDGEDDDA